MKRQIGSRERAWEKLENWKWKWKWKKLRLYYWVWQKKTFHHQVLRTACAWTVSLLCQTSQVGCGRSNAQDVVYEQKQRINDCNCVREVCICWKTDAKNWAIYRGAISFPSTKFKHFAAEQQQNNDFPNKMGGVQFIYVLVFIARASFCSSRAYLANFYFFCRLVIFLATFLHSTAFRKWH